MTNITTFDAACICIALAALVLGLGVLLGEWLMVKTDSMLIEEIASLKKRIDKLEGKNAQTS